MRTCFCLFLLICLVLPVRAETVRVRSGEHADFSRLVFDFSRPTGWDLHKLDTGYAIVLDRAEIRFDLSQIFRFIPRDRLAGISFDPATNRLKLAVACQCHAEAFEVRPDRLVIDVKDGPDPDVEDQPSGPEDPSAALSDLLARPAVAIIGDFTAGPQSAEPADPGQFPAAMPSDVPAREQIADMQKLLLHQLSRAAAQGLVQTDIPVLPEPSTRVEYAGNTPPDPLPKPSPPALGPGLTVETSVDRGRETHLHPTSPKSGRPCLPADQFDVAAWGQNLTPNRAISKARGMLLGEFDQVDPEAQRRLARAYLFLGFGAEARAVLRAFDSSPRDVELLTVLARIADGETVPNASFLSDQLGCDAPAALWAALAVPTLPRNGDINRDAIERAFSALPLHLRRQLGPGLAERFLAIHDHESASRIRNAVARAGGDHGARVALMQARLDMASGRRKKAEEALSEIATGDKPLSSVALLEFLKSQLAAGKVPRQSDISNAEALAFEQRGTPQGRALLRVSILGSARKDDYAAAFDKLKRAPPSSSQIALTDILTELTQHAADAEFLRYAFSQMDRLDGMPIHDAVTEPIARRLLKLGFWQPAQRLLGPRRAKANNKRRLLRGRIALAAGDPSGVLDLLAGIDGTEAARLRGDAESLLGNRDAAARAYDRAGATAARSALAWQSGDWEVVAKLGNAAQAKLARSRLAAQTETLANGAAPGPESALSNARTLLEQSVERRNIIEGLVTETDRPRPPEG